MQNENSQPPPPPPLAQPKIYPQGFLIRKVNAQVVARTVGEIPVTRSHVNVRDQGYLIVRISKFIEVLRDPTVLPLGSAIVQRISLDAEGRRLMSHTFILHKSDITKEREFLQTPTNSTQSPIMVKLGITSIEDDRHRYIIENLREVGLGSANCLEFQSGRVIDEWKRIEFFSTRRLAENIEAIRKTPRGSKVIFEWQGGRFVSLPLVEALERAAAEHRNLAYAIQRIAGVPTPGHISRILSWDPSLYNDLTNLLRRAKRQTSAILENHSEKSTAAVVGESMRHELPIEEAIDKLSNTVRVILEKAKTLIGCHTAGEPDIHSIRIRNMKSLDRRIIKNIESLRKTPTGDRIRISTITGGRYYGWFDGIHVVDDQIGRNIRTVSAILSGMGYPPTTDSHWISTVPGLPIRRNRFFKSGEIPSSRREFSTTASRPRQTSSQISPAQYKASRSLGGPSIKLKDPGFGMRWEKRLELPKTVQPKLASGSSVRDRMVEKEKERLGAMSGLTYGLLSGDRQEGGGASVQRVIEKESFHNVGAWEGGEEAGGLTDESGIEPLRKGDMCEIR